MTHLFVCMSFSCGLIWFVVLLLLLGVCFCVDDSVLRNRMPVYGGYYFWLCGIAMNMNRSTLTKRDTI